MLELFNTTKLTRESVAKKSGFLDWGSQPTLFKHYPSFLFSYAQDDLADEWKWLLDIRYISQTLALENNPYHRLNIPSAGNLHPVEIYVQCRSIQGVLSGIYHIDAEHQKMVLVRDIERDGLESPLGLQFRHKGLIFVVTTVPFRSYWKYHERAIRYCFHDVGHQLAALDGMLKSHNMAPTFLSDYHQEALEHVMGFAEEEYIMSVAIAAEASKREVKPLVFDMMRVAPTSYYESTQSIQPAFKTTFNEKLSPLYHWAMFQTTFEQLHKTRRSAREFLPNALHHDQLEQFMNMVYDYKKLSCSFVVLRAQGYKSGIYDANGRMDVGFYPQEIAAILVNQRFLESAAAVLVFHTNTPDQQAHMNAGILGHWCYLLAEQLHVGCSAIGAYYDDELRSFLSIEDEIVYVLAIGDKA